MCCEKQKQMKITGENLNFISDILHFVLIYNTLITARQMGGRLLKEIVRYIIPYYTILYIFYTIQDFFIYSRS